MTVHLFVCGTLLPEYVSGEMANLMGGLRCVGEAEVKGRLYDLGEYPGAVLDASSPEKVLGLLYELHGDQSVLRALDSYEGFDPDNLEGSLFVRRRATATLTDGRRVECWVYAYNRNTGDAPLIPYGDYRKYRGSDSLRFSYPT